MGVFAMYPFPARLQMEAKRRLCPKACEALILVLALSAGLSSAPAQTLKTLAGGRFSINGPDYGYVDGDNTTSAQFDTPLGLAMDGAGNLLVADYGNNAIRKLDLARSTTSTLTTNMIQRPVALALDRTNNLYVLNEGLGVASGTLVRFGWEDRFYQVPKVLASDLRLPTAMAIEGDTNVFVTESGGGRLFQLNGLSAAAITPLPSLANPNGIAVLDNGSLAISDGSAHSVWFYEKFGRGYRSVLQLGNGQPDFADGEPAQVRFYSPQHLVRAPNGVLVMADRGNHRVRLIATNGMTTTLYGMSPTNWLPDCLNCNPIVLSGWYDGVNGNVATAEAREPVGVTVDRNGVVYTSEIYYHIIRRVTGTGLVPGGGTGGEPGNTNIVSRPPIVGPLSGYYPMGVDIVVIDQNADPVLTSHVYYTADGSEPGPGNSVSREVALTNGNGYIAWRESERDLSSLRVKAFLGGVPSTTVRGQLVSQSQVGVPGNLMGGVGSTVLVPVVANLRSSDVLRSLQFLLEITPSPGPVRLAAMSPNDFIPMVSATTNLPIVRSEVVTNQGVSQLRMLLGYVGTNSTFHVAGSATVAFLAVPIPTTAVNGQAYAISITAPSGTSDAAGNDVPLVPMAPVLIMVTNKSYLVGDTSPAGWYNAGTFGDGNLRNSDVNSAFYASLGVRIPPALSDAFDAMDAFPEDTADFPGGDGRIRFLDWQVLLDRATRFKTNNWSRRWAADGTRRSVRASLPALAMRPAQELSAAEELIVTLASAQGRIEAQSVGNVQPGAQARVPIVVSLAPGARLAGCQLRAAVEPANGAPAPSQPVRFVAAPSVPSPMEVAGLPANQVGLGWSPMVTPLATSLEGRTVLGELRFEVPATAVQGQTYRVRLSHVDGSPDLETQYALDAQQGSVCVRAPATTVADRWIRLRWQGVAGRKYVVESTIALGNANWQAVTDEMPGYGRDMEFAEQDDAGGARFYRVRRLP